MVKEVLRFADFELDRDAYELRHRGRRLRLERIPLELLFLLAERRGRLVTRPEIVERLWGKGVFLDAESAINTAIRKLRRALGDDQRTPRFVSTVPTQGYRFIGLVERVSQDRSNVSVWKHATPGHGSGRPEGLIVGREDELAWLGERFARVSEGTRRVVFVTGEPGIGKTTFLRSFLSVLAHKRVARIARGQCIEQYGSGEPYLPVLEALTRLGREANGSRVIKVLRRIAPSWLVQMPSLLNAQDQIRLQPVAHAVTQARLLREIAEALEELARQEPLVIWLEDLHWSDYSTLELISVIARRTEPARLMVIGTYRPVEVLINEHRLRAIKEELELHNECEELRLGLLNAESVANYLKLRIGGEGVAWPVSRAAPVIYQRTEGNPLFMVNVIDYLLEQGSLFNPEITEAPRTIRQMVERNFERLKPEEQTVLEVASVAGARFSAATVASAMLQEIGPVEASCSRLARQEQFLSRHEAIGWPDGTTASAFRFRHSLYQEVLYDRIPAGRRIELHRRVGEREEAAYGERTNELAAELAHHFSCANITNKAVRYSQIAGDRAVARGAMIEGERHYRHALELLSKLPRDTEQKSRELALRVGLGLALLNSRGWAHSETQCAWNEAQSLSEELGDSNQLWMSLGALMSTALTQGSPGTAQELAKRVLRVAKTRRDRGLESASHYAVGQVSFWRAEFAKAEKHLALAQQFFDENSLQTLPGDVLSASMATRACVALQLGFPDSARHMVGEALKIADRHSAAHVSAFARMYACFCFAEMRSWRQLLRCASELKEFAMNSKLAFGGIADFHSGLALLMLGKAEEGVPLIRTARASWESMEYRLQRALELRIDAEMRAREKRYAEALLLVDEALQETEEVRFYRASVLRLRADLQAASGFADQTETSYREAIGYAGRCGSKFEQLQTATRFARWLKSQGRAAEAGTTLAEIFYPFTEGMETSAVREARSLLEELGAPRPCARPSKQSPSA